MSKRGYNWVVGGLPTKLGFTFTVLMAGVTELWEIKREREEKKKKASKEQ